MMNFFPRWQSFVKSAALFGMIATVSGVGITVISQHKKVFANASANQGEPSGSQGTCLVCGGWLLSVSPANNSSSEVNKVLTTFDVGGAVVEFNKGTIRTGVGSWKYYGSDRRKVAYTFIKHRFTGNEYVGMSQVTHYIEFNPTFDQFSGYGNLTRFQVDGSVTKLERVANIQGYRIKADVPVGTKAAPNIP